MFNENVDDNRLGVDPNAKTDAELKKKNENAKLDKGDRHASADKRIGDPHFSPGKALKEEEAAVEVGILPPREKRPLTERLVEERAAMQAAMQESDAKALEELNQITRSPEERGIRSAYEPTESARNIVAELVFAGINQERIAKMLGISVDTLKRYFDYEINEGGALKVSEIATTLWRRALAGDTTAAIFVMKTHGGVEWREKKPDQAVSDAMKGLTLDERDKVMRQFLALIDKQHAVPLTIDQPTDNSKAS